MMHMRYSHQIVITALCSALSVAALPIFVSAASASQVSIAGNGQAIVRDAIVTSKSGNIISASTRWGKSYIEWKIIATGSTRFYPESGSSAMIKAIRVGDLVSFAGELDESASMLTVSASSVRDSSLLREGEEVSGKVLGIGESSISIVTLEGTTTVAVGTGTIMTLEGDSIRVGDILMGDEVRALGRLNTLTNTLEAARLSVEHSAVAKGPGFFSSLLSWLRGSGGTISVR